MKRFFRLRYLGLALFAVACDSDDAAPPVLEGTLAFEVLDSATVRIDQFAGDQATFTFTPSAGFDLLAPGQPITAQGFIDALPEADSTLYSARMTAPAPAGGPCMGKELALALSLHRQGAAETVGGGVSVYCEGGRFHGVPVRVLRLAGRLVQP
jgi:hypothetical protein